LDIGGGYWPEQGEWLSPAGCAWGRLWSELAPRPPEGPTRFKLPADPIEVFAEEIGAALARHVFPHGVREVYAEPGRWIAHECMHFLLTLADAKDDDILITDGGTNLVGWERYEHDWFPVVNLTRPGEDEHPRLVLGALCTPHDVWGTSIFGDGAPRVGDVVCIPWQGAYTWSLRQHFIKPIADSALLAAPRA
jgi:diaminopimelate decarboxylase